MCSAWDEWLGGPREQAQETQTHGTLSCRCPKSPQLTLRELDINHRLLRKHLPPYLPNCPPAHGCKCFLGDIWASSI